MKPVRKSASRGTFDSSGTDMSKFCNIAEITKNKTFLACVSPAHNRFPATKTMRLGLKYDNASHNILPAPNGTE